MNNGVQSASERLLGLTAQCSVMCKINAGSQILHIKCDILNQDS